MHRASSRYDPIEFLGVLSEKMETVGMSPDFLARDVNSGFSGGEKKRNEILQMALLEPEVAILVRARRLPAEACRQGGAQSPTWLACALELRE